MRYLCILAVALASCSSESTETKKVSNKSYTLELEYTSIEVTEYVIDNCQYIGRLTGDRRSHFLTHKGNCNNPIHSQ
jgi:hypothetical protein